jgi:glycosyltransferase involved in cell wall biosynthesis
MKILHTVAPAEFGGLEEVVIQLSRGLRSQGHRVAVASILTGPARPHPFLEALDSEGVDLYRSFLPPRTYLREIGEIRRLCESLRPDVVHTHGYRPDVLHRRAAWSVGIPMVTTVHGFTGGGLKNRFYEWLQVRSVRSFDAVVAVSRPMAAFLWKRGVPPGALHVIPNAWEPRFQLKSAMAARAALRVGADRFHIGWVGRLTREKGPDLFLDALSLLHDRDLSVSVIGDGGLRDELEQKATSLDGLEVRFHGFVPDAGRLFSAFDLLVISSRSEGTPIVLFEAMDACVPVVATAVGGVPDIVGPETVALVPPDNPVALAEAMRSIRHNTKEAKERAERARRKVRHEFSTGPWVRSYETVYSSVLRNHSDKDLQR